MALMENDLRKRVGKEPAKNRRWRNDSTNLTAKPLGRRAGLWAPETTFRYKHNNLGVSGVRSRVTEFGLN